MKIFIGADHSGFVLKSKIIEYLMSLNYEVEDKGAISFDKDDDYPDFIIPVAESVVGEDGSLGIVMGGSGQGEAMCANKTKGVRAVVFYGPMVPKSDVDISGRESTNPFEIVKLARIHNNANILSLGVRFVNEEEAKAAVKVFLETKFSGDERHLRRINKMN